MGEKYAEREREMLFDILYRRIFIGDTPVSRGFPCKKFQVIGVEMFEIKMGAYFSGKMFVLLMEYGILNVLTRKNINKFVNVIYVSVIDI